MSVKLVPAKRPAQAPPDNDNLPSGVVPCWPEPPEAMVNAAAMDVPEALLAFSQEQADGALDLAYRIAFADEILQECEDAGPERSSPEMAPLSDLLRALVKDQAPERVPIIVPAAHPFIPWPEADPLRPAVLVRDLARQLRSVGDHLEAAGAWAIHGCVRQGLLGVGIPRRVRTAQVGGLYPRLHPDWRPPDLEPVTAEGGATADFDRLAVWATPALWEWWRHSPSDAEGAPTPAATPTAPKPRSLADRVAYAVGLLYRHTDWTDARIAQEVGVSRTTLYDWPQFKSAKAALEAMKRELPRGHRTKDGGLEAYDEDDEEESG